MNQTSLTVTPTNYTDLEIRILEQQDEGYPVEITFSGEQEFPRGFLKPDIPKPSNYSLDEYGEQLFEWFFADNRLKTTWTEVRGQNSLRRIRLRIDASAPELHTIPWELLRDATSPDLTPQTLAADTVTPFSRYLTSQRQHGHLILSRPIKLLIALANPENLKEYQLEALDVEAEQQTLEQAVAETGIQAEQLEITVLEQPVTLSALEMELKKGYHILHIVSHGMYLKEREQAVLFLADKNNQVERVSENDFAEMPSRLGESLRLVFLASCQTATNSSADAFRGFAPKLIASGVPAVVAMQDLVPIDTARQFASTFYCQLLQHGQVDLAANEARSSLLTAKLTGASIPVVFMRLRSGMLFGQRGQILREKVGAFWKTLLSNIERGKCTPILGSGITREFLPSPAEVAKTLAAKYNYPFPDHDNLPRVAQFMGTLDDSNMREEVVNALVTGFKRRTGQKPDPMDIKSGLSEIITSLDWSALSQQRLENEVHHQLADLALPLYITTSIDNFMTLALQSKEKKPRRETIAWRDTENAAPDYVLDRNGAKPIVLHLYGTDQDLLSMVVTEDDYLDYLTRISRDHEYLIPKRVSAAIASTTLLFLGYHLEDLELKVLMRGLLPQLDLKRWKKLHVAVQIDSIEGDETKQQEVIDYFQRYFRDSDIDVYLGSVEQFVNDLYDRWKESIKV